MKDDTKTDTTRRSRARRNVVGGSPNRAEYVSMMEAGWASQTMERYAAFRYGEDIPASTFRSYRLKQEIVVTARSLPGVTPDQTVDVIGKRAELIRLQEARIAIDLKHETDMNKLFGTTKGEIALLNSLLSDHKGDLQDLGLMPKAGEKIEISGGGPKPGEVPVRALSLGELLGRPDADPAAQSELARVLHMATKRAATA